MHFSKKTVALGAFLAASSGVQAIDLDTTNPTSIKSAAATIANDMMKYYTGNTTGSVGLLPQPYYWWEAGAMWGGMVDYWFYTGDESYVDTVGQAIISQQSPTNDFMMPDQHFDLGNDDQVFWALTAMSAAEHKFPVPNGNGSDEYLQLATNTFNDMVPRWNTTQCAGGLKWQIFPNNTGYDYKSSIANAGFFQLSARLAHYTGNTTYSDWASKTWDWMSAIGLIDANSFAVYDGTDDTINCTGIDHDQWSYSASAMLYGSAMLANTSTNDTTWANRTQSLLTNLNSTFFTPYSNASGVMYEQKCEATETCDTDQFSFKAYMGRWMMATAKVQPQLSDDITSLITASAQAAAKSCTGGDDGNTCGTKWYTGSWDGSQGVGQQLSALEVIQGLLAPTVGEPAEE